MKKRNRTYLHDLFYQEPEVEYIHVYFVIGDDFYFETTDKNKWNAMADFYKSQGIEYTKGMKLDHVITDSQRNKDILSMNILLDNLEPIK